MKLHRFYVNDVALAHDLWLRDERLYHQWTKVLRFQVGREVVLFNVQHEERLYRIIEISNDAVHLDYVTDMKPKTSARELYLCFSLIKKDKNEWVLQKGTELGVRHFVPLISDRTEKTGFDADRAEKILIEAAEQCGRVDIPSIRKPLRVDTIVKELSDKTNIFVAQEGDNEIPSSPSESLAVLIGPEGGWSDDEKEFFKKNQLQQVRLSPFTLRAETACVASAVLLLS